MSEDPQKIDVDEKGGRYFLKMSDLLNRPTKVREEILPRYGMMHVTRFGEVVMRIGPASEDDLYEWDEV